MPLELQHQRKMIGKRIAMIIRQGFLLRGLMALVVSVAGLDAGLVAGDEPVDITQAPEPLENADAEHDVNRAHAALRVRAGYSVRAIAREPLVADPVSARLDLRGRLWVVEMPDYPLGPPEGTPPSGRIKILTDGDRDGVFDQATLFAEGLLFATGVQPYRDGAFVTLAGKISFFRDLDGDDQADEVIELFSGFAEQNQQLRANHPTLGPDGLIYVAGGLRGGSVQALDSRFAPQEGPVDLRDRDFCFDPEGGWWGAIPGKSQFGVTLDDFGRRLGCSNRNPAMMSVLSLAAVQRDPMLVARDAIHDVALSAEKSAVFSRADAWTTSNLHSGQFSAACGVFAPGWTDDSGEWLLACEPTAYLIQRQKLVRDGSVWMSRREPDQDEFLSSTDTWFRPVDLTAGPQESALVVDMARAVIEHPDFMPSELKSRPDQRDGTTLGRIWQVTLGTTSQVAEPLKSDEQALQWLCSESAWQRASASQYLFERGRTVLDPLRGMVLSSDVVPVGRARAAWLLSRSHALTDQHLTAMMDSSDARLRALGVQLSRGQSGMLKRVLGMAGDADPLVARHVAAEATSAADHSQARIEAMLVIANQWSAKDHWIRRTLASSDRALLTGLADELVVQQQIDWLLLNHLVERIAIESPQNSATLIVKADAVDVQASSLTRRQVDLLRAWVRGVRKSRQSVIKVTEELPGPLKESYESLISLAIETSRNLESDGQLRANSLMLAADFGRINESLRNLVNDQAPPVVRVAALPMSLRHDPQWTRNYLVQHLTGMTSAVRSAAVSACVRNPADAKWLLQKIEAGDFPRTVVDPATAKKLGQHPDQAIRSAAGRLFATDPNRAKVLKAYAATAATLGDAETGKKLFTDQCSACHQVGGVGTNVGPDISDSRTKTPAALLTSILDPNAAIDSAFIQYSVLTVDGRILDGLLVGETAAAVTLQQKGGQRVSIPREDIERLQAPGISLMPEGFEQTLNPSQMSDLLSYLKNWRYLDGSIPGEIPGRN